MEPHADQRTRARVIADGIDNNASVLDDVASNTSNAAAADVIANSADALHDKADNVRDAGAAKADNVTK